MTDLLSVLVHVYWSALTRTDRHCIDTTIGISNHIFIGCEGIEVETRLLRMNPFADVVLKHQFSLFLVGDIPVCVCSVRGM
jgi:hypothetical protein